MRKKNNSQRSNNQRKMIRKNNSLKKMTRRNNSLKKYNPKSNNPNKLKSKFPLQNKYHIKNKSKKNKNKQFLLYLKEIDDDTAKKKKQAEMFKKYLEQTGIAMAFQVIFA